jgi:hypothetical protein
VAGRYEVGDVLASGGVGTVHTGFDRLAQRPVAYKRLLPAIESARSRLTALFRREYDTLTHLTHPNIVEVYDYGFDATGPYYTMELLSGSDLAKLAPLPIRDACRVLRDVASALALLHARRFVHRDVSPNNVRLTSDGRAKLIDFGGLTEFGVPGEIVGTAAFMAPESLIGAALDQRTDLYSLGALAYWTLTRRTHVQARSLEELPRAWEDAILPPSHHVPAVPKALDELVLSLLQYDPVARPGSAADVAERLTTIASLPVEDDEQRVAFSYLQHAPQLGREAVTATLEQGLRAAIAGDGQMVLLEGEQGLGRSSVLHQLAVNAQLAGATVLRVDSGLHTTTFSAARHLVDTGLRIFPDLRARARDRSSRPARLVGRTGKAPRSALDASEHQAMLANLLTDDLLQLSRRTPLVVLVDDAHTIDAESLALFASMAEPLSTHAILMVLSMQTGQAAHQPDAQAKIESSAQRCKLTPLSEEHLTELVGTMFGGVQNSQHLALWLHEQTGGNPGHCIDLTRLLLARGAIRYSVGTFTLPREFEEGSAIARHGEAALASIAGLPQQVLELAYLAGVHTGSLTSAQLSHATGLSARDVVLACELLLQRGVLVASPDSVSCASESLRSALASSRGNDEKRAAHLALASAIGADAHSIEARVASAQHLLAADGEHALAGASLLASIEDRYKLDLACSRPTLPLLESALSVLDAHGVPEEECLGVLIPLSLAGFYGQLDVQYRYLPRVMNALSLLLGVTLAQRLRRYLGAGLALIVGMCVGYLRFLCTRRSLNRRNFLEHFANFGAIPSSASAASACAWDVPGTYRIAHMLDPFEAAAKRSPMYLMRKFCLATADLVSVKLKAASDSYAELYAVFLGKVLGLDPLSLEQFRCGCLHGQAQALVTDAAPEALVLADELERRHVFFAPHAAGIRMSYHLYRGEVHKALPHRQHAEALALRGGTSWSAMSVLTLRMGQGYATIGDVVGLVHVVADLERIAKLAPSVDAIYMLAKAHLELLRGQPERALMVYERVLDTDAALALPSYPIERSMHVQALCALGRHQEARTLGLALIDNLAHTGRDGDSMVILARLRLANAEAGLGNLDRAAELIDSCFERAHRHDNPLALGGVHRERAYLAALAGDADSYALHLAAASEHFAATENPWLIQQVHSLRAQGTALGMGPGPAREPSLRVDLDGATAVETVIESGRMRTGPEGPRARETSRST